MNKSVLNICFSVLLLIFPLASCTLSTAENSTQNNTTVSIRSQAAVASAHPLATQVGIDILNQGGNAFDAAVAVTATLAVVEPYSSGIGGGGFYLLHQKKMDRYIMLDAREAAPLKAHKDLYLDEDGMVIKGASITGALSAGIPGIPAALAHLAEKYGALDLKQTLATAITHANDGFPVDEYYQRMARFRLNDLRKNKAASNIFLQQGQVPVVGFKIVQKNLAKTLNALAENGSAGFYQGEIASKMISDVSSHGGLWSDSDLETYAVIERKPDIAVYKRMKLISASLPSSGGLVLSEILAMLAEFDIEKMDEAQRVHHIVEAMRRAYRDRAEYMGDPDFIEVPAAYLVSDAHIKSLSSSIDSHRATSSTSLKAAVQPSGNGQDTTHFSIIDKQGNKVSATLSINYPFGSCYVAQGTGVLLNDEMDDFVAKPGVPNVYGLIGSHANAIAPGKRMLSSMTPSFVETPERIAVIGTPGGSRIITMVLIAILEFYADKSADEIVNAGRFHHQYLPDEISFEPGVFEESIEVALQKLGHKTRELNSDYGNMQVIVLDKKTGKVQAASDARGIGSSQVLH